MFAKRPKQSSRQTADEASQTAQSGPDAPEPESERLERELAEQRALAATLRESLDAATFKIEILEKSYAKQLAEAREKSAAIEAELKDKNEILANLGGGHEHTLRELNDALAVIKVLKAERDKLRKEVAQRGFRQPSERPTRAQQLLDDDTTNGGTINQLIASAGWVEKKPSSATAGHSGAQVTTPEAPATEMLAPDLVFTDKDKDDER